MIKANKILRMVRRKVKDNNEVQYSDYDVLDALNECIRYISMDFSMKNSDFLEKIKKYRQDEMGVDFSSGVDLPSDFLTLVSVIRVRDGYHMSPIPAGEKVSCGGYKVFAGKIFCSTDFTITYRAQIGQVKDFTTDEIGLPEVFTDTLVKITCMILQDNPDTDVMMREISRLTDSLIPSRRYSNVKRRMPFIC